MKQADKDGLIVVPRGGRGVPRLKRYLDEQEGIPVSDSWNDIPIAAGRERLGYPTQKPRALLERIIAASSNEGDLVPRPILAGAEQPSMPRAGSSAGGSGSTSRRSRSTSSGIGG